MSTLRDIWRWCPYPKRPKSNTTKLSLPVMAFVLLEIVLLANVASYYNTAVLHTQNTATQITKMMIGATTFGWDSTMKVPEVNSVVPASSLTPECTKNQTEGIDVKYVGTYKPDNAQGTMNITIVNFGDSEVHLTSVKLYENDSLVWSQAILKVIPASSATTITISIPKTYNSTQINSVSSDIPVTDLQNLSDIEQTFKIHQPHIEDQLAPQVLVIETAEGYTAKVKGVF